MKNGGGSVLRGTLEHGEQAQQVMSIHWTPVMEVLAVFCQCLECAANYNATNQLEVSFWSTLMEVVARQGKTLQVLDGFCIFQCWTALGNGSRKVGATAGVPSSAGLWHQDPSFYKS